VIMDLTVERKVKEGNRKGMLVLAAACFTDK
jgi:hypothetical protein